MHLLIVNPAAGGHQAADIARRATQQISEAGGHVETFVSDRPGHARDHLASTDLVGVSCVVAIGGDGTIFEVVNGLMEHGKTARPCLGVLPAGSGNSLAEELEMGRLDIALNRLLAGKTRQIDLLRLDIDGRVSHSINVLGWGAVAEITRRSEPLRFLGGARYTVAALRELCRWRLRYPEIDIDGVRGEWLMGMACTTRFVGAGMMMAPRAELDDGLVDLVLVNVAGRVRLLGMLLAVFKGKHINSPLVEYRQVQTFRLDLADGTHLVLDGEIVRARRVDAEVLPSALELIS